MVDREEAGTPEWPGDTDLVPLDPTRAPCTPGSSAPSQTRSSRRGRKPAVDRARLGLHRVPFFTAAFESTVLHVPMYAPMAADERLTIDLLRDAYSGNVDVTLRSRPSLLCGRRRHAGAAQLDATPAFSAPISRSRVSTAAGGAT